MVKLTTNYLIKKILSKKQQQIRRKEETDKQFLNRLTHLYLQGQFIDQIGEIKECQSVIVIYLQNNTLRTIHNFENFPNVTHLYLQRNKLTIIENLEKLINLKKLYLGYNELTVIEGLENAQSLVELHVEGQNLPLGETLYFDPRTVQRIGNNLQVLNVSKNNLTTLSGLVELKALKRLIASENSLSNLNDVSESLKYFPVLQMLNLTGNPVTNERKYRDVVIYNCKLLVELDGKTIPENTRSFIENFNDLKISKTKLAKTFLEEGEQEEDNIELYKDPTLVKFLESFPYSSMVGLSPPLLYPKWKLRANMNPEKFYVPHPFRKKSPRFVKRNSSQVKSE